MQTIRFVYCSCYVQLRVVLKKERMRFIVNVRVTCKQTLQNNLAQLKSKEKETQENLSKTNCYNFSFFFVFIVSLSWKFWPHLACEYRSLAVLVYDLTLMKGRMKSFSNGLLTNITLQVECLAPGQSGIICTKANLLRKWEQYASLILMSYMGTI